MGWRYISHVLPEWKSVTILVVNERPPCTPISVSFNKVGLSKEIVLIFEKKSSLLHLSNNAETFLSCLKTKLKLKLSAKLDYIQKVMVDWSMER